MKTNDRQFQWTSMRWIPRVFFVACIFASLPATAVRAGELLELTSKPLAPDFDLEDIGGRTHRLSDLRGDVVLINFWASWCAPCRAEMPSLERLKQSLSNDGFHILAVNRGETKEEISRFYFSLNPPLTFSLLMDTDNSASQYWPTGKLPMTFIVDKAGRVTHVSQGARRWDTVDVGDVIRTLQGAPGEPPADLANGRNASSDERS